MTYFRYISHLANVTFVEEVCIHDTCIIYYHISIMHVKRDVVIFQVQKNHQGGLSTAQLAKEYFSKVSLLDQLSNVIESHSTLNCFSWRDGWWKHFTSYIGSTLRCSATHPNFTSISPKCRKKYQIGLERLQEYHTCRKTISY